MGFNSAFKGLNAELNPICHLLALLGAHHILHISRIRVKEERPAETQRLRCVNMRLGAFLFIFSLVCRTGSRG